MQLCRAIYYSLVPWLLYMFRAILSFETCRETKKQGNNKLSYTVASCWSFYENCIVVHGNMNVNFKSNFVHSLQDQ